MEKENRNELLWSRFKGGNKNAFAEIYQLHIKSLIAYGSRLCSDENVLKDNIQDLFIELWNSRENLSDVDSISFYLCKSLRYKLIRSEKYRQSRQLFIDNSVDNKTISNGIFEEPIETRIVEQEVLNAKIGCLQKAIKSLSKRQQEAIQLRFYQGFSNEQIAELLGMNYQSVSNLLYNSLCRIKKNLKEPSFSAVLASVLNIFL